MKMRRKKTARVSVIAAGGIAIRDGRRPLFAVVQRRKDNFWVLPKGKLKRGERPAAAARREVIEETGHGVRLHEFLGAIASEANGKRKVAHFWRMQATLEPRHTLARDIKAVEWLSLSSAIERLTQPIERAFLDHIGGHALTLSRKTSGRPKRRKTAKEKGARTRKARAGASRGKFTRAKSRGNAASRGKSSRPSPRPASRQNLQGQLELPALTQVAMPSAHENDTKKNALRRFFGRLRQNAALT